VVSSLQSELSLQLFPVSSEKVPLPSSVRSVVATQEGPESLVGRILQSICRSKH
jgi:hypothetical protein